MDVFVSLITIISDYFTYKHAGWSNWPDYWLLIIDHWSCCISSPREAATASSESNFTCPDQSCKIFYKSYIRSTKITIKIEIYLPASDGCVTRFLIAAWACRIDQPYVQHSATPLVGTRAVRWLHMGTKQQTFSFYLSRQLVSVDDELKVLVQLTKCI